MEAAVIPPQAPARPAPLASSTIAPRLASIVGERRVLVRQNELLTYTADGLPGYRKHPAIAVIP
ncbi:MAG: hypothetical protein HOQ09_10750 [Gemmatimonadaceae bacterium]|nr:hypothetical protein [Gemmatimonadaceae bacterium]